MKQIQLSFFIPLIIGESLLFIALLSGLKMTSDSHLYFVGAEYLHQTGFMKLFDQDVFLAKPLLFPLFLVPFIGNLLILRIVHHLLFLFSFYISDRVFSFFVTDSHLKWVYNLLFATSTALIMVHVFVWTEPLFLVMLLLYVLALCENFREPKAKYLVFLAILGLLMCALRHVGVFFILIPSLLIFVDSFRRNCRAYLKWLSIMNVLLPITYFLLWQWLVWSIGGNHERINHFQELDVIGNYGLITEAIATWFLIPQLASITGWVVFPMLVIFIILTIKYYNMSSERIMILSILGMLSTYLIILFTKGDMIFSDNERYVSVIFPMVFILLIGGLDRLMKTNSKIKPLALLVGGVLISYNVIRVLKNVWFWSDL